MKISWGVGISATIIFFMLVSIWLIYFSFSEEVNLVRDDYYEAEVQFNDKMEAIKRTKLLNEKPIVKLIGDNIGIKFPSNFNSEQISGHVNLYRPSDGNLDIVIPISVDSTRIQYISTENLIIGLWKIKIEWKVDTIAYFNDEIIMVQ